MRYNLFLEKFKNEFKFRNVKEKMILKIYIIYSSIPYPIERICVGNAGTNKLSENDVISFHFDDDIVSIPYKDFKHKDWFGKIMLTFYTHWNVYYE